MTYIMATVVVLTLASLGVFLVVTVSSAAGSVRAGQDGSGRRTASAGPRPQAMDAAEEELRLRYARGEIGREEFLQRKIDLER